MTTPSQETTHSPNPGEGAERERKPWSAPVCKHIDIAMDTEGKAHHTLNEHNANHGPS